MPKMYRAIRSDEEEVSLVPYDPGTEFSIGKSIGTLVEDVAQSADWNNGLVIARALQDASMFCTECDYPQNHAKFRERLSKYIKDKLKLKKLDRYGEYKHISGKAYTEYSAYSINELHKDVRHWRRLLSFIWPCQSCIERYNPTRRQNHPKTSTPCGKEFLDE